MLCLEKLEEARKGLFGKMNLETLMSEKRTWN